MVETQTLENQHNHIYPELRLYYNPTSKTYKSAIVRVIEN